MEVEYGFPSPPSGGASRTGSLVSRASGDKPWHPSFNGQNQTNDASESRSRRKLQKSPAGTAKAMRRRETPPAAGSDAQTEPSSRRPSIRHYQPPQGARPLNRSPSKPYVPQSWRCPCKLMIHRRTPAGYRANPHSRQSSFEKRNQFNFGVKPNVPTNEGGNPPSFLPEVNFDDLHNNITGCATLEAPDSSAKARQRNAQETSGDSWQSFRANAAVEANNFRRRETRTERANATMRPPQQPRSRIVSGQSKSNAAGAPDQGASHLSSSRAFSRRQSQFPAANLSTSAPRTSRKSVGPGFFPPVAPEHEYLQSFSPNKGGQTRSVVLPNPTAVEIISVPPTKDLGDWAETPPPSAGRGARRKSVQPSRNVSGPLISPNPPESPWATTSVGSARSPARESFAGATTPSSGKRMSMMPGHATGLGARTISPTDARRMKRMSMMPAPPPLPNTPPVVFPEPPSHTVRSAAQSPSMIPRKSVTPSSNRTTPDQQRKSLNSAVSISSSTSMTSLRGLSRESRSQQNASTSRLPTLKPRSETALASTEERVPPVPAIPKAFGSPHTEQEVPFFSQRMPSFSQDMDSVSSNSTAESVPMSSNVSRSKEDSKEAQHSLHSTRALPDRSAQVDDQRASGAQNGRRTLQPIRLPPLNLRPLDGSSRQKNGTRADPPSAPSPRIRTPPPRKAPKTPSTPMTASRASFFHAKAEVDESSTINFPKLRSSSSHFASRSDASGHRAPSVASSSDSAHGQQPQQQARSPFLSSSAPKTNGALTSPRTKPSGRRSVSTAVTENKSAHPTGPRTQNTKASRTETINGATTPATDTETTSFGSTLRRKLSLTRKRSTSKAEGEKPAPDHDREAMPPPKLPASATWTNPGLSSSSAANLTQSHGRPAYLHTRRKSSVSDNLLRQSRARSEVFLPDTSGEKTRTLASEGPVPHLPTKVAASPFTTGLRSHGPPVSKPPLRLQSVDTRLDRDDLVAEEEMKKLAARRKNTEMAARELDALRRRASAKEPASPSQALRTAKLNLFERGEIVDYQKIYFSGTSTVRKLQGDLGGAESANFGYDDERGDYNIVLGDHLAYRYEVVDVLGKGSFGQVVRCVDHRNGSLVAIKIIRNKKRFHQQALVEVNILQKLRDWVCL